MYSRLVVPLVCAAALVFACGPRPRSAVATAAARTGHPTSVDGGRPAAVRHAHHHGDTTGVDASLDVAMRADGVQFALNVVNQSTKRLEIDFPDGRTRDFAVLDATGREVWRWSRGRLFTQTVQNKFLASGDTATYQSTWEHAAPGAYTAVAILRSRNFPVERRVAFTLRAPSAVTVAAVQRDR